MIHWNQLNRCQSTFNLSSSNMLSAIFHATSPTPKRIHPTLQHHPTSYTKKHPPRWLYKTIPDRVLQASTSTTAEGSMELLENWNQRQVRPLKFIYFSSATLEMASWESANISWDLRALTESILVVLLLSLRIQWFFEHQQSKTKKGRVSVNFPKLYQSKRSTISGYNGYNAYESTWKQLIKMKWLHMWGHLTVHSPSCSFHVCWFSSLQFKMGTSN